jgi:hypothetical protein
MFPHGMLLIVCLDLVKSLTLFTVVRLVCVVNTQHVLLQMWQLCKCFVAQFAHVRLLSSVHSEMKLQSSGMGERSGMKIYKTLIFW